jgi:PAS domain S-box-containing protein
MDEEKEQLKNKIKELEKKLVKHENTEQELKDSQELFKVIFEEAPDGYFISDLKGIFIDGNKVAQKLIGYKEEEIIGKSMLKLNLISLDQIPKAAKRLAEHAMGRPSKAGEFILTRKDGSKVWTEISGNSIKIKGKNLVLGIVRDITDRKKIEEELKHKNSELEKFNKLALGREFRIIDLKNKIKELEKKLEQ